MPVKVIHCLQNQPSRIQKNLPTKFFRIRQTASNEFQCKKIVLFQQQIPHLHTWRIASFLSTCRWRTTWNIKHDAIFSKKVANQGLFFPFTVPISNNVISEKLKIFYQLKSPKTPAIRGKYRFLSAVNLEKWRMKLHIYALLTNFLELALLILININSHWQLSKIHFQYSVDCSKLFLFPIKIQKSLHCMDFTLVNSLK